MSSLGDPAHGRANNWNLIRLVLATMVLLTHSYALVTGDPINEPLRRTYGLTLGTIAVDGFFVASGFLVTASVTRERGIAYFVASRCLRIYPGLWVMLLLTVFGLGAWCTTLRWADYLGSARTLGYLARTATLVTGVRFELPGVFASNPFASVFNGSLWTLPYEVGAYACLFAVSLAARICEPRDRRITLGRLVLGAWLLSLLGLWGAGATGSAWTTTLRLLQMFFAGAALHGLRDRLRPTRVAIAGVALSFVALFAHPVVLKIGYPLLLPLLVVLAAHGDAGRLRGAGRFGDYSYGIYIYAFPVQQCLIFVGQGASVAELAVKSFVVTLALAVASWHLVEKPCIGRKRAMAEALRRLSAGGAKRLGIRWG
ncbi:MAG: acyltransferase [Burkholderiaceae bacterium]